MEVTTWSFQCRIPEAYSACIQCLAAQALLMMLDIAEQVVAGVVALVNCLCHWQDGSVLFDELDLLFFFGLYLAYSVSQYGNKIATAAGYTISFGTSTNKPVTVANDMTITVHPTISF